MKSVIYKTKKGSSDFKNYKTNDTNEEIKRDIKANGCYLIAIINEEKIKEVKNYDLYKRINSKMKSELIDYIQDVL